MGGQKQMARLKFFTTIAGRRRTGKSASSQHQQKKLAIAPA
jgi:hypothetical protein